MRRARVSPEARRDAREIAAWLRKHNPRAADAFLRSLRLALRRIAANPGIGHRRDDLTGSSRRRILAVAPYLVVYHVQGRTPEIGRIVHAARDVAAALRGEDPSEE